MDTFFRNDAPGYFRNIANRHKARGFNDFLDLMGHRSLPVWDHEVWMKWVKNSIKPRVYKAVFSRLISSVASTNLWIYGPLPLRLKTCFESFCEITVGVKIANTPFLDFKNQKNDVTFKSLSAENGISLAQNKWILI